jgi:hypothetical protein
MRQPNKITIIFIFSQGGDPVAGVHQVHHLNLHSTLRGSEGDRRGCSGKYQSAHPYYVQLDFTTWNLGPGPPGVRIGAKENPIKQMTGLSEKRKEDLIVQFCLNIRLGVVFFNRSDVFNHSV